MSLTKKDLFLSNTNINYLSKKLYEKNLRSGNTLSYNGCYNIVVTLVKTFPDLDKLDTYESLIHNVYEEIDFLNQEFIKKYSKQVEANNDYKTITPTYKFTVDDYRNLDPEPQEDKIVNNSMYRYDNTIPLYQRTMNIRHYDRSNDGLVGRSLMNESSSSGYDMSKITEQVEKPYSKIDDNDKLYYGHEEENSLDLMSTNF